MSHSEIQLTLINRIKLGEDFYKLLKTMNFNHLVTAHGESLFNNAFLQVLQTVKRIFS